MTTNGFPDDLPASGEKSAIVRARGEWTIYGNKNNTWTALGSSNGTPASIEMHLTDGEYHLLYKEGAEPARAAEDSNWRIVLATFI